LVEAIHYNLKGNKFQLGSHFLKLDLSIRTVALGTIQPLPKMCTRDIAWEVKAVGVRG
jgi:hypothetical protein